MKIAKGIIKAAWMLIFALVIGSLAIMLLPLIIISASLLWCFPEWTEDGDEIHEWGVAISNVFGIILLIGLSMWWCDALLFPFIAGLL